MRTNRTKYYRLVARKIIPTAPTPKGLVKYERKYDTVTYSIPKCAISYAIGVRMRGLKYDEAIKYSNVRSK